MNEKNNIRRLCEGALCIALALVLSFLKVPVGAGFGGWGGSIDFVMIPLIVFAVRWGALWGVGCAFVFGVMKYFFASGFAISWVSILLDYSAAYGAVGLAGVLREKYEKLPLSALLGCVARFVIHFLSGVTVYAQYMPEEFLDKTMTSPAFYSLLYNGTYMLPNTIIAVIACALLIAPMKKIVKR